MINLNQSSLYWAIFLIIACPLVWNILGRVEYRTQLITRLFKTPQRGCYAAAAWIFTTSLLRNIAFKTAIHDQPTSWILEHQLVNYTGNIMRYVGLILVVSSFLRLGIIGTYLGDYFGILMDRKIDAFPFNIVSHPMYAGATMIFLGESLICQSPTGLLLTGMVSLVYYVASIFEGPFTEHVYSKKLRGDLSTRSSNNVHELRSGIKWD